MQLDDWQKQVLETEGNICIRAGRQVGKSTVISLKACQFAAGNAGKNVMVIASVERQASLLFEKILNHLYNKYPKMIKKGKDRPTKHIISLTNGSKIYCLPTGLSGYGIRGYTIHLLIADEAAFIPEEVWTAVTPMLAVTKGDIWLLSTPHGREGYYYRCFEDESFTKFHVSSEDCPRKNVDFLKREKERMTKLQYTQEYLGEFIDELKQFFPSELIRSCMRTSYAPGGLTLPQGEYFAGVDIARMGEDQSVICSFNRINRESLIQAGMEITRKTYLTDTIDMVKLADIKYNYKKIFIDDAGVGAGVYDVLLQNDRTKRKIVSMNNAKRLLDKDGKTKTKLVKEAMYANLLRLMEQSKVELIDDPEIYLSLKSIQYEYLDNGDMKIYGTYSHIAEAIVRAAWCMTDKTLNIWCR